MTAITIKFNNILRLTDDQFYQLCRDNPEIKFERNIRGEITIMSPTGGETGKQNASIIADFVIWNRQTKLGIVFDSSTCFKLSNNSNRSPDVSWVKLERWNQLTPQQREKFPPIAPDFVLELMSPSDSLKDVQNKMLEYMDGGVKLGWLIDNKNHRVEIYRQGKEVEILDSPTNLSGEDVLPGLILEL
ncbi:MAG: Uma2 family endonuclease [Trichodesmium sp. St16_bin4-tuft]|nr:Uma2 family endonuclease [Trichodesmium sp. MAG_R01]MDE5067967.1 Uma2 family endonuclease [Trichodesmium sp. St4_bin8_1]MDE5073289.1 Uma2 family endonuclease [Trichodesmium sp. St5_bin8]MDE5079644.1 Uma2 family endonuclease [Trichodesmium sp. St2_bin6]MDE5091439.1 Uma2 family endonuclease [Trichodesmium sp. St18_bin3_1_1]MDE5098627.1 Uma2 family endonuclease [Trichodesmium sp. St16_bin4-tuft]MDE5104919.1 Uma2 family endonuclease [Trichodesmium sp. St19_bin2]